MKLGLRKQNSAKNLNAPRLLRRRRLGIVDGIALAAGVIALCAFGIVLFRTWDCCIYGGEGRLFLVAQLGHHAWTVGELLAWARGASWAQEEVDGDDVLKKHSIGYILISHFHLAFEREPLIHAQMAANGFTRYRLCSEWDRQSVLERANINDMARLIWPDALSLLNNREIKVCKIKSRQPVYEGVEGMAEEMMTSQLLGRVANERQHFAIWQEALDAGWQKVMVLEDDSLFVQHFAARLDHYLEQLPEDFDIAFIGGCAGKHAPLAGNNSLAISTNLHKVKRHRCASGYVLSQAAMIKLLSHDRPQPPCFMNIDPYLEYLMGDYLENSYWFEPPLMYEASKALFSSTQSYRFSSPVRQP